MTLNIFSTSNIWSRVKQQVGKFGEIECLDATNETTNLHNPMIKRSNDLYVGTIDGFVHKFRLREKTKDESQTTNEKKNYECLCIASQNLGTKKSIVKLKVVTGGMRRLIGLSENVIFVLDSDHLQFVPNLKLKNVVTFAVSSSNENQSSGSIDFCVSTKRNKIQIYRLDKTNLNLIVELSNQETLLSIAMDEKGIFGCSESEYFVHNFSSGQDRKGSSTFQSIFRLTDPTISTCLTNISPGEYLLNGPNMAVTSSLEGTSQRAPIMFESSPIDFIYSHPYILVLVRDSIKIYSYLDNELKQEIFLRNSRTLNNFQQETTKTVIVTTRDEIFLVEPLSIEQQIDQLLQAFRLQEALTLAESSCTSIKQRQTNPLVLLTKKRIALIEFTAMNVDRALVLFEQIKIDFHEIIEQIPNFSPIDSPWPKIDENLRNQYVQWLNTFSSYMNKNFSLFSTQQDFHPALLKAYVLIETSEILVEFVENGSFNIPLKSVDVLLQGKFYHSAALLYSIYGKHFETIEIWKKIVTNEFENDETFPGVWLIAKYVLERNIDRNLEFSAAEWLLEQNHEELALKIFIDKHRNESNSDLFSTNRVVQRLKNHSSALTLYLENVVFKMKIDTDEIHTRLINIYLDEILSKSDEENQEIRTKLQSFIISSDSYRIQSVLNRINQTNRLRREVAILHGKMNQFERAFEILVEELGDFDYAENYCVQLSQGKSSGDRRIVAHVLFKVLLNSLEKNPQPITEALLRLLCNNDIEFDFIEVLQRLPADWSLASLSQILIRALRTYSYNQRAKKIQRALSRVQNENLTLKLSQLKTGHTVVNEYRRCKHCLQQFYESSCVVYQDGSQVHVHCAKQYQPNQKYS